MRSGTKATAIALAIAAVVVFGTAGCGGGSDDEGRAAASTTTTEVSDGPARDFSRPGVAVIAHRGASADAPEHTNAAYTLAIDQGADYIEIDVQLTKDGQLVALHDPSLDRTARGPAANCTGFVSEKTVEDLYPCDVGTWFNEANPDRADPRFARQRIPLLTDVLSDYGEDTRYYIEVKSPDEQPDMIDALLAALDEEGPTQEDPDLPPVVIQSFSADALRQIHEQRPELPLVQLVRMGEPVPDAAALDDIATYAVAIGPPMDVTTRALVDLARARCLDVHPYTVDETAEMGNLLDAGVGGIFTNAPAALRDLLPDAPMDTELCAAPATQS